MTSENPVRGDHPPAIYAHSGNASEQRYLEKRSAAVEAAFLLPYLKPGVDVLDCGCGPGTITVGLAPAVSPGRVTGIDMEAAQIERARQLAVERDVTNAQFKVGSIYEIPFSDTSFEVVFANAVFEHLREPLEALAEIHRVLKPGGMVALRDADLDVLAIGGPNEALLKRSYTIMAEQWQQVSGNPYIGRHLRSLLHQAGYVNCEATSSAEHFGTAETTRWFGEFMALYFEDPHVAARIVERGLTSAQELDRIKAAWWAWGESPASFAAVLWCEAVGWKKSSIVST